MRHPHSIPLDPFPDRPGAHSWRPWIEQWTDDVGRAVMITFGMTAALSAILIPSH